MTTHKRAPSNLRDFNSLSSTSTKDPDYEKKCHYTIQIYMCTHRKWTKSPRVVHVWPCSSQTAPSGSKASKHSCPNMATKPKEIHMDGVCEDCKKIPGVGLLTKIEERAMMESWGVAVENAEGETAEMGGKTEPAEVAEAAKKLTGKEKKERNHSRSDGVKPSATKPLEEEMQKSDGSWFEVPRPSSAESWVKVRREPDWDIMEKDEVENQECQNGGTVTPEIKRGKCRVS